MKKQVFLLGMALLLAGVCVSPVLAGNSQSVQEGIKLYKSGNYSGCIQYLETVLAKDPSNAVAHYYMALANTQAGRVDEAIDHYDTVIRLNSQETLVRYSKRGKLCLEDFEKCSTTSTLDEFIRDRQTMTNSVKNTIETQDLDSLRRDINDNKEIDKARLKKFKRFSYNDQEAMPTNDEIVAAMQTLQRAGFAPQMSAGYSDISGLYASSYPQASGNAMDNLMNLMSKYGGANQNEKVDPRLIQTMMTSQMLGF